MPPFPHAPLFSMWAEDAVWTNSSLADTDIEIIYNRNAILQDVGNSMVREYEVSAEVVSSTVSGIKEGETITYNSVEYNIIDVEHEPASGVSKIYLSKQ